MKMIEATVYLADKHVGVITSGQYVRFAANPGTRFFTFNPLIKDSPHMPSLRPWESALLNRPDRYRKITMMIPAEYLTP